MIHRGRCYLKFSEALRYPPWREQVESPTSDTSVAPTQWNCDKVLSYTAVIASTE